MTFVSTLLGWATTALSFVVGTIVRGAVSILVLAVAAHLWRKVNACRGRFPARPYSLLYFPTVAALLAVIYILSTVTRISLAGTAFFLLAVPAGLLAGLAWGGVTHMYASRWDRVLIVSKGRHLDLWFAATILAALFRILPDAYLSAPTMALFIFSTGLVIAHQLTLYVRYRALRRQAWRPTDGPPIDLDLSFPEAVLVSVFLDLAAARRGPAEVITFQALQQALSRGPRGSGDVGLAAMPGAPDLLHRISSDPAHLSETVQGLVARGVLVQGLRPGPVLEQLLALGSIAHVVSLGRAPVGADGRVRPAEVKTVLQTGGRNFIVAMRGAGAAGRLTMREADGAAIAVVMREIYGLTAGAPG